MGKLKSVAELNNIIKECEKALNNGGLKKKDELKIKNKLTKARKDLSITLSEDNTGMMV